jgi:hypothetical protein
VAKNAETCPGKGRFPDETQGHLWTICQTWDGKTGERGVGVQCAYCRAEYLEPEPDVLKYFLKRREAAMPSAGSESNHPLPA